MKYTMKEKTLTTPMRPTPRLRPVAHRKTSKGSVLTTAGDFPFSTRSMFFATPAAYIKSRTSAQTMLLYNIATSLLSRTGEEIK